MTEKTTTTKQDRTLVSVVFFITLIGLAIRLSPALQVQFPLNDGGLFYAMILDLQTAHYTLPLYTIYNLAEIPFAYPPLGFYFTGLLSDLLHIPLLDIVRILPPIVSALSIPAFYLLAKELTESKIQIAFSVLAFALLPRVFEWHIMGGGVTRSFGLLFALLTMRAAYRFYTIGHATRHLLGTILLGALTLATHPEATVHTAIAALVFYLWKDRSLKGLLLSLGIAGGILALTSPWWGLVINRHGIAPFLASINAAGQNSFNVLVGLVIFFRFLFTDEAFLPVLSLLGLVGLFASLARKQTFLPAWMFIIHLIEPRGGSLFMMIPMALLIGYGLDTVILPKLCPGADTKLPAGNLEQELLQILSAKGTRYFLLFVFAYSLMSAYITGQNIIAQYSMLPTDIKTFNWVRDNTPEDAQFVLVTGQLPLRDAWSEWFPVLAERRSQASVFGYEWVNDGQFGGRVEAYEQLQSCAYKDVTCLDSWQRGEFSYVYLWNRAGPIRLPLALHLQQDAQYNLVYENEQTVIFQKGR